MRDSWQRLRRRLLAPRQALLVVVFVVTTGMGMVWSILAVYATSLGASTAMVGLIFAMFGGSRLAVSLPAGIASERFGRRPLMLPGLVFLAASSFVAMTVTRFEALLVLTLVVPGLFGQARLYHHRDGGDRRSQHAGRAGCATWRRFQGASTIGISLGPASRRARRRRLGLWRALSAARRPLARRADPLCCCASSSRIAERRALKPRALGAGEHLRPTRGRWRCWPARLWRLLHHGSAANWVLLPLIAREKLGMGPTGIASC